MLKSIFAGAMGVIMGTFLMTGVACAQVIGSTNYVIKDLDIQVPPTTRLYNVQKVCQDGKAHVVAFFQNLKTKKLTTGTYRMRQYDPKGEKPDIDVACRIKKKQARKRLT